MPISYLFIYLTYFIALWSQNRARTSSSYPIFLGVDFQSSTACCCSPQRRNKRSICAFALHTLCKNNTNKEKNHPVQRTVSSVRLQLGRTGVMRGQNREVRLSGWSGQMAGIVAATLNILFDFDSYFPPSSSSRTTDTSVYSDLVPTEEAPTWGRGCQRLCKWLFFSNIKAHSRRIYF